jgi:hypothetical protein
MKGKLCATRTVGVKAVIFQLYPGVVLDHVGAELLEISRKGDSYPTLKLGNQLFGLHWF